MGKTPSIPQGEQGSGNNAQHTQGEQGSGKNAQHTQGEHGRVPPNPPSRRTGGQVCPIRGDSGRVPFTGSVSGETSCQTGKNVFKWMGLDKVCTCTKVVFSRLPLVHTAQTEGDGIGSSHRPGQLGISTRVCILIRHKILLKGISLLFFCLTLI